MATDQLSVLTTELTAAIDTGDGVVLILRVLVKLAESLSDNGRLPVANAPAGAAPTSPTEPAAEGGA